jgi:hypothetical protein
VTIAALWLEHLRALGPEDFRGGAIRATFCDGDRYLGDALPATDWTQYDTDQDAWYFGVWVNRSTREVLTYAEGDWSLITLPTADAWAVELARMAKFYGPTPAHIVAIDVDAGTVTEYRQERPE